MNDNITEIIIKHSELLNSVNNNQPISRVIKELDHIVQNMYLELYGLKDGRKCLMKQETEKKGHCC